MNQDDDSLDVGARIDILSTGGTHGSPAGGGGTVRFLPVHWAGAEYSVNGDDLDELPAPPVRSLPPEDRALLELAARAIGCVRFEEVEGEGYANLHFADGSAINAWNPLVHSDDAFDLIVRLDMGLDIPGGGWVYANGCYGNCSEPEGNDKAAATRRAITRAAAEIGKQQPAETSIK